MSLVSKFISSRRSITAFAGDDTKDISESWSGLVNVSEEAVKAELKRAEEMAVLNKVVISSAHCFCLSFESTSALILSYCTAL